MKKSTKKLYSVKTLNKASQNKKPTKVFLLSSKKETEKDDKATAEQKDNNNNNKKEEEKEKPSLEEETQKRDKIIHENNQKVISLLQSDLEKLEKENELLMEEMNKLKEEEQNLSKNYEDMRVDIEKEKDGLEELKDINEDKNHKYLQLLHLRHQQIMANPVTHPSSNERANTNSNNNTNTNVNSENRIHNPLNHLTLGNLMDGLLGVLRRVEEIEATGSRSNNLPFIVFHSGTNFNENDNNDNMSDENENLDDGPPVSYAQLQALPSYTYPRNNNNNEKCTICGFEFCFNDVVTNLVKCKHIFHKNCLVNRLSARKTSKCPTCNISVI